MSMYLKMVGSGIRLKGTALLASFLRIVKYHTLIDLLEKFGLFSDFQYGFSSSRSTGSLVTVASERNATTFNRSGANHDI